MSTSPAIKILHLENDPFFGKLTEDLLAGQEPLFQIRRVENWNSFTAALNEEPYDLIFASHLFPGGDGLQALRLCRRKCPSVPFIFVTGNMGEEPAIDALKNGATDYVLKSNLSRLIPAVSRALSAHKQAVSLRKAHDRIRRDRAKLLSLIETASEGIWSMDLDFTILIFNSAASLLAMKMSGRPMAAGKSFLECISEENHEAWHKAKLRILNRERFQEQRDLEWNGQKQTIDVGFSPIATDKAVTGMVLVSREITDRKRAEEAMKNMEIRHQKLRILNREMYVSVLGVPLRSGKKLG